MYVRLWPLLLALCAACGPATAIAGPPSNQLTPAPTNISPPAPTPPPAPTLTPIVALAWPTSTPVLLPSPTSVSEVSLLFTGDINPARCVYWIAKEAGDMTLPYQPLADILRSADLTIGSLDAAISDINPPSPCAEFHRNLLAPSEVVAGLEFAGFDVMAVATNHVKDCGLVRGCVHESLFDTLANLRAAGIRPVGAGANLAEATAPVVVTVHGTRFAFLAFTAINDEVWAAEATPGAAPLTREIYLDAIQRAKGRADVVIVLPHWGREFTPQITWEQSLAAQAMVEAGATLVVGNNPHHVQGVETFANGAVVAYALGNFVFDMTWSDGTQFTIQGIMLKARFSGAQLQGIELIPIHIYQDFQPRLAPPEEAELILQAVADSLATIPGR